jgi:aryl-alcohol dehydrogenase-like predicted oxidoreductase
VEAQHLPLCRELGIGFVAYSPLGRGLLTGQIGTLDDMAQDDRRRDHPRFSPENLAHNVALVGELKALAAREGCSPAQLAISWVLSRDPFIVPIPGTSRRRWLEENVETLMLTPSADSLVALDRIFADGSAAGTRYPAGQMKRVNL